MLKSVRNVFAICIIAFASMQSAQAVAYGDGGVVYGYEEGFSADGTFAVEAGVEYTASFLDVFDNFLEFSLVITDEAYDLVGYEYSDGTDDLLSFVFTAASDSIYNIFYGANVDFDTVSTYIVKVETTSGSDTSPVPVPGAIWFMGTALLAMVNVGRRKI